MVDNAPTEPASTVSVPTTSSSSAPPAPNPVNPSFAPAPKPVNPSVPPSSNPVNASVPPSPQNTTPVLAPSPVVPSQVPQPAPSVYAAGLKKRAPIAAAAPAPANTPETTVSVPDYSTVTYYIPVDTNEATSQTFPYSYVASNTAVVVEGRAIL
ncbi:unnamed protein product [Ambrosiozyma monospora]|uniref:Unnamed protein product n=1 Tax=Ambrosiozyma monospora TaxID=43982 RepID=A0ACB5UBF6_AMBMO|nr:unnamed protein product [Ambrosiozyma monospora]